MSGNDHSLQALPGAGAASRIVENSPDRGAAGSSPGALPLFDEWNRREFERSPWPLRIFDHETLQYLAVNDPAAKLYGYSREEFLALTARDTRHPEEHAKLRSSLKESTGFMRPRGPRRHIKKSGEVMVVEVVTQDVIYEGRPARLALTIDVTERVRMQELLYRRQREFETLAENLPDLVARFDRDHRFVYVNSAVEKLTGRNRSDMVGRTQRELGMPNELVELFQRSLAEAVDTGDAHLLEFRFPAPGGERLFEAYHVPERDAAGNVATVLCIARDITGRVRAERQLKQRQKDFESLAEHLPDIVVRFDRDVRHIYVNAAVERLTGLPREAFIGKTHFEIPLPREKAEHFDRCMREVFETGRPNTIEFRFETPEGERYFEARHIPEFGDHGEALTALCIGHDITARKRAEDTLRESEERFRLLAENIGQVFWINTLAVDNNIYVSPAYEKIWGRSRESLRRDPDSWKDAIHPDDVPKVREGVEGIARGVPFDEEYRIIRPDGTLRWIRDRSYPMRRGDGTLLACGIAEDITDIKRAAEESLMHAAHQRAALVREVHHRIKNSLQGVAGLLRQKIRKYPAIAPGIEEAIAQLQSVALVYGLQETRPDGLITLAEIMDAVCASAEGLTGGHVERMRESRSTRPACVAGSEAVSVAVALNELVFNALKHQAGTGRKRAKVTLLETKDAVEIRVANRGRLPRGFDYPAGRGVGHGLGLVRTLLAAPGGSVAFNGGRNEVEVVLHLRPPLLAGRQQAATR